MEQLCNSEISICGLRNEALNRSLGVREEVAEAAMNHCKDDLKRVYNLYEFWPECKEALRLWHEKIDRLRAEAMTRAA